MKSKKLLKLSIFHHIAKDPYPKNGLKMQRNSPVWIYTTTCHITESI